MSSNFFLKKAPKANKKRKLTAKAAAPSSSGSKKRVKHDVEEIASDDEESDIEDELTPAGATNLIFSSDDEAAEETAQDKRLRLAKEYLQEIAKQEAERAEDRELHDHVAHRLQTEYLDSVGKLRRNIAGSIVGYDADSIVMLKHKQQHLPVCSMALSADGQQLFTGAKTQFVLKWNLQTRKIVGSFDVQAHREEDASGSSSNAVKRRSHVVALCLSSDNKYLALAEGGKNIQIWCPKELKHLKTFKGHRDMVTCLVFRQGTHELYSGAKDRAVKIWSLDEMAYVESLFGHQTGITGIDALSRERAISSGGNDCTLRIWKITEESQLVYNGHRGSIETVKFLNDEHFVSGGDDGALCLWSALKKKPLCTETLTHGQQQNGEANWISAISCVVNTDLIATASCDGFIRLWQSQDNARKIKQILQIPIVGFVNGLAFNANGSKLFAAVGQEHRLGRWWRIKEAKNSIQVFELLKSNTTTKS